MQRMNPLIPLTCSTLSVHVLTEHLKRARLANCQVKNNVTAEARRKSKVTGQARLTNAELRPVLLEFIHWSAALPSQLEFHVVWRSIQDGKEGVFH